MLMPARQYATALKLLSSLARLLTQPAVREGLLAAASPDAVLATVDHGVGEPPSLRGAARVG
jgi:mannitol/fructose-specific phosphotransferase system IIA component (Ntr-type)